MTEEQGVKLFDTTIGALSIAFHEHALRTGDRTFMERWAKLSREEADAIAAAVDRRTPSPAGEMQRALQQIANAEFNLTSVTALQDIARTALASVPKGERE